VSGSSPAKVQMSPRGLRSSLTNHRLSLGVRTMDFRSATDTLSGRVEYALATALGFSLASIRRTRLQKAAMGKADAPKGLAIRCRSIGLAADYA
jgi:hypothetical protein